MSDVTAEEREFRRNQLIVATLFRHLTEDEKIELVALLGIS